MRDNRCEPATIIHTVGYEKSELDDYVKRLQETGIELLVDVRERPQSRKRGFSKNKLREAVEAVGIEYRHVHQLGDPKPGREAARAGDHALFVEIFSAHMELPETKEATADLASEISGRRICLTCFERDHSGCHRTIVAEHLANLLDAEILHIKV